MAQASFLTGEYRHALDDRGRVAIPSRFRGRLAEGATLSRWLDRCLGIFPAEEWNSLAEKIRALPMTNPNAREFARFMSSGAVDAELDRQGRVLVPQGLRAFAGLENDAMVLGSRDHAEIWAPVRWDEYSQGLEDPSAFAAAIAGLGI